MLKIGEFSKLSRVSVRMLRHYDEVGLLAPSEVDPMTGYRYYSERQLITAGRIAALRALGFGLSDTRELLRLYDDRAALDARLAGAAHPAGGTCRRHGAEIAASGHSP